MAASNPRFFFSADHLVADPSVIRYENGYWVPPRRLGRNWINRPPGNANHLAYYHDGYMTSNHPIPLPHHLINHPYMSYSLYMDTRANLWIVPYDASTVQVHDGNDGAAFDPDDPQGHQNHAAGQLRGDWRHLSFCSLPNNHQQVSYASYNQRFENLLAWRANQHWVEQLLPERYIGPNRVRRHCGQGGLVGDIALLLGLVALSIPQGRMHIDLPRLIQRHWGVLNHESFPGYASRTSKRGVRITVWLDLADVPHTVDPQTHQGLTERNRDRMLHMEEYQRGVHGRIYN